MPELPDVEVCVEHLRRRIVGKKLLGVRLRSPFLVRTFDPPMSSPAGRLVHGMRRMGKRVATCVDPRAG